MLNKLRCHTHFKSSANQFSWSRLLIQIQIMNGKQCKSRSVGFFRSKLIWIYTVCKHRAYPGSAGQGLKLTKWYEADALQKTFTQSTNHQDIKYLKKIGITRHNPKFKANLLTHFSLVTPKKEWLVNSADLDQMPRLLVRVATVCK